MVMMIVSAMIMVIVVTMVVVMMVIGVTLVVIIMTWHSLSASRLLSCPLVEAPAHSQSDSMAIVECLCNSHTGLWPPLVKELESNNAEWYNE